MTAPLSDWAFHRLDEVASPLAAAPPGVPETLGKYRVLREISRGGMGIVCEGRDTELDRIVAVKILQPFAGDAESLKQRFQREVRSAAKLDHPNVIRIYDAGEDRGVSYLVMERIHGRSLQELIPERRGDLRWMLRILEGAARGVAAAHAAGIIHRDVKPSNILIDETGTAKVGDFGLARPAEGGSDLTRSGTPIGTPSYMSPEQVRGREGEISPSTDVYGLGAILYEMITGRPPHTGETTAEIYTRILGDDPAKPRLFAPRLPADLETICLKALERMPAARYPTAKEFAEDLRRHLDGEGILARPPSMPVRLARALRRHRLAASVGTVTATAVVIVAGILLAQSARDHRALEDFLREGAAFQDKVLNHQRALLDLATRERDLASALRPSDGEERRRSLWEVQAEIRSRSAASDAALTAALSKLHSALAISPRDPRARSMLSGLYLGEFLLAEQAGDDRRMAMNEAMVRQYDDGRHAPRLARIGRLSLETIPAGAEVDLQEFREGLDHRLEAHPVRGLGVTPLTATPLAAGSYVLVLRKPGFRDVRYPLVVTRDAVHEARVPLLEENRIGEDFIYVPGGPFLAGGGDPSGPGSRPERREVPGFLIARHEVTQDEYVDFLNALLDRDDRHEFARRIPLGMTQVEIPATGPVPRLKILPEESGRWPVTGVNFGDAHAYIAWRNGKAAAAGERARYRLPSGLEWEKAARGADGRLYPWGNQFDYSFAKIGLPEAQEAEPSAAGTYAKDASPYGVMDMAGNAIEYCNDPYPGTELVLVRGGSWIPTEGRGMVTSYFQTGAATRGPSFGFRLAKVLHDDH